MQFGQQHWCSYMWFVLWRVTWLCSTQSVSCCGFCSILVKISQFFFFYIVQLASSAVSHILSMCGLALSVPLTSHKVITIFLHCDYKTSWEVCLTLESIWLGDAWSPNPERAGEWREMTRRSKKSEVWVCTTTAENCNAEKIVLYILHLYALVSSWKNCPWLSWSLFIRSFQLFNRIHLHNCLSGRCKYRSHRKTQADCRQHRVISREWNASPSQCTYYKQ